MLNSEESCRRIAFGMIDLYRRPFELTNPAYGRVFAGFWTHLFDMRNSPYEMTGLLMDSLIAPSPFDRDQTDYGPIGASTHAAIRINGNAEYSF